VVTGQEFVQNQKDSSYELDFRPPPQHVESSDIAIQAGLVKAYKLPAPDGNSRSLFTVAFQKKAERIDTQGLSEFVDVDLRSFKKSFSNGEITQVNIQGRIATKLSNFGFPFQMFIFKGNQRVGSSSGDALVLFFATPDGFWSIVWTIPQQFIQQGFSVFFEPFIESITARATPNTK
jgi:hypothetical protein